MLPTARCASPCEELQQSFLDEPNVLTMDKHLFRSETFQRSYQYLSRFSQNENLDDFIYTQPSGNTSECIKELLRHCSVSDPTWCELRHFASFLNTQLRDCEKSIFCDAALVGDDSGLSGFKNFVVHFMIKMSQDFATPSLEGGSQSTNNEEVFDQHQLCKRRRWEENVHPYLFFNEDQISMTFLNFLVDTRGNLLHPNNPAICLEHGLFQLQLLEGLKRQNVNVNQNFDSLSRHEKLTTLCRVMGLDEAFEFDPDPSYELTTDNVLKMLAIHMRFRCGIPVIVMGETGCGKTRMVEFMSRLKLQPSAKLGKNAKRDHKQEKSSIKNVVTVKVHGGITVPVIQEEMLKAVRLAQQNRQRYGIDTMLFLDEANTTEAIYAIKEYVCDGTINGEVVDAPGLRVICACNPYKKHTKEAIEKMSEAGLGFRVRTEDTSDKLGNLPMRCLVYRVIALPPSMKPLVWDFGQLSTEAELVYIQQMVSKLVNNQNFGIRATQQDSKLIVAVLSTSQAYMRRERSQCLFVSLRDVERCLQSFLWFYQNSDWLYNFVDEYRLATPSNNFPSFSLSVRSLIHAIGMCYHVTLEERESYRQCISQSFEQNGYGITAENILDEITACQCVFCNSLDLEDNIARNEALRENCFMIAMCTEMRIPLFLIGKPGSSKSLAKTVITDAMQGASAKSEVFRKLKQIHVLSFQCSAVSDAVGIEAVFTQCAQVQKNQDSKKFVSVVVLDEVGLAEDSPKMPLKVLHPLLEGNTVSLNNLEAAIADTAALGKDKVGFVGISNWALDPAKMNRGIFVTRGDPSEIDLENTAKGIFSFDETKFKEVNKVVKLLTQSYLQIRDEQSHEFFGLRDYYGLLKMIFSIVKNEDTDLAYDHVSDAISRNFNGGKIDCFDIFVKNLIEVFPDARKSGVSVKKMINDNLQSVNDCESRFLLLLTNRFAAINLLNKIVDSSNFQVIFGSSFPQDNDYTELCRNINKIKICMESGKTVVLLNLRNLYESLYDALNQHYVTFAGQRYVDLGLGGNRVKCRIAKDFRLIVIEDKNVVYDEFPIPLINRLEKYIFTSESILIGDHLEVARRIEGWVNMFTKVDIPMHKVRSMKQFVVQQSFLGYNDDSAAATVLNACESVVGLYQNCQRSLLNTASMDAVFRLPRTKLKKEAKKFQNLYLFEQSHDNLVLFLQKIICSKRDLAIANCLAFEITSFSQILVENDRQKVENALGLAKNSIMLLTLQQFQTQEEFTLKVESFFDLIFNNRDDAFESRTFLLFLQCPQAQKHGDLIACSRFSVRNVIRDKYLSKIEDSRCKIVVAFLYTMDRHSNNDRFERRFSFHNSDFVSVFIDELRPSVDYIGPPSRFWNKSVGQMFDQSVSKRDQNASKPFCRFIDPEYLFDADRLVRSCIPIAMLKVTSHQDAAERNRVLLLNQLFAETGLVSRPFRQILLKRIICLLKQRDLIIHKPTLWSIDEACSQEALYEGGTFSKTLWLRLRKTISSALGKIVSIIDEDNNLDILCQENPNKRLVNFWLCVFDIDGEVCKISANEIVGNSNEFMVRGSRLPCRFPFSRRITECFSRVRDFALTETTQSEAMFFARLKELKVNDMILDLLSSNQMLTLELYIHDLVYINCKFISNELEFQLFVKCLQTMFTAKHKKEFDANLVNQGNFLAVVYYLFAACQEQLIQLHEVLELVPELLTTQNLESWTEKQSNSYQFIVHVFAYNEALIHVEQHLDKLIQPNRHQIWKDSLRKLLNLKLNLLRITEREFDEWSKMVAKMYKNISSMRNALAFVDLFLSVLVPENQSESAFEHYLEVLVPIAKRLWKGAKIKGLNNAQFLQILIKILQGCSKDLYLKLLLAWQDLSCKCCNTSKIVDPVILPCHHYFCEKCVAITTAGQRQCPTCRENLPDDFVSSVAKLSSDKVQEYNDFKQNCTSFFLQYLSTLCFPLVAEKNSEAFFNEDVWKILEGLVIRQTETREMTPMDIERFDETPTVRSFILQLLLRFDRQSTQKMLEHHFEKIENVLGDRKELMVMYIRCVEDLIQVRIGDTESNSWRSYEDHINEIVHCIERECSGTHEVESQVRVLDLVAEVRLLMKIAAKLVHVIFSANEDFACVENARSLLESICRLLETCDFNLAKGYFVKLLCRQFSLGDFRLLLESGEFLQLIPSEVNPQNTLQSSTSTSCFYLFDENFAEAHKSLLHFESEDEIEELACNFGSLASRSDDAAIGVLHALRAWICKENSDKDLGLQLFNDVLEKIDGSVHDDVLSYFKELVHFEWPALSLPKTTSDILEEFVSVAGSTIMASLQGSVLHEFKQFITFPSRIMDSFLPTMPQSCYFDIKPVIARWVEPHSGQPPKEYLCPSGHVYFIGDCTNPNQEGRCPDCRKAIGGVQNTYQLQPGNTAGTLNESSQAGYLLGTPENRPSEIIPERSCSRLAVCVLRMFLHATMLHAARRGTHVAA